MVLWVCGVSARSASSAEYSVGRFCSCVRQALQSCPDFSSVIVSGEVANLALTESGHCYFSLTDGVSSLACTFFRSNHVHDLTLQDGMRVRVVGELAVHPFKSVFQLNAFDVLPAGAGSESFKVSELRKKLDSEGLFSDARKRPLPRHPHRVGIICAKDSEAQGDVVEALRRLSPGVRLSFEYVRVTGPGAAASLCNALCALGSAGLDVVILTRGGGPQEDFSAFNDESVVRAVAACPVPVVTGIGHESDETLCDLVADVVAITPTAAAHEVAGVHAAGFVVDAVPSRLYLVALLALVLGIGLALVLLSVWLRLW